MSDLSFYQNLPVILNLSETVNPDIYTDIPVDWFIAIADVQNSTALIQDGRYKEVNAIAAATITAVLNTIPAQDDLPFVFGGDGATLVFPRDLLMKISETLIATQRLAKKQFGFNLRVGIVPIQDVIAWGYQARVAKLRFSKTFHQALFTGGGLAYAEQLVKDDLTSQLYLLRDDGGKYEADFSGYECRWSEIPSRYDENVNVMIQAVGRTPSQNRQIYQNCILKIEEIYGDSAQRNPISVDAMPLQSKLDGYSVESRIRYQSTHILRKILLFFMTQLGHILLVLGFNLWEKYKNLVMTSTDREKFDDMLKMLIAGTVLQRDELVSFLETQRREGKLVYGIQVSRHALMTCLIIERFGRHVHFVDGSNGGYTLAALQLKKQLTERSGQLTRPALQV